MLSIASVIANRARQLGVSPQAVVGVRSEFNAYGKALPKGVNAYRPLAQQAWDQVQATGPIHGATFYATPSAVKNLPKGLQQIASTTGHVYFTDPLNRAIKTATGFVRPVANIITGSVPTPTPRPQVEVRPHGMEALAPNGLIGKGSVTFDKPHQAGVSARLSDALLGSAREFGTDLGITSGYRSPAHNRTVGGARSSFHTRGEAADIDLKGMSIPDREKLVRELTQRGAGGFITYTNSPNMMHVDMRSKPGGSPHFMHDRTASKMGSAPGWFQDAAKYGGLRTPDSAPVPTPRSAAPAAPLPAAPVSPVTRAPLAPASLPPDRQMPSGPIPNAGPVDRIRPMPSGPLPVSLPPDRPMPMGPLPPQPVSVPPPATLLAAPQIPAPPLPPPTIIQPKPVYQAPQQSFPVALPTPPPARPSDVYAGMASIAKDGMGNTVFSAPGDAIGITNRYGATTFTLPDGRQAAGMPSIPSGLGPTAKRAGGAMLGSTVGGLLGPVGSALGALVGSELAKPGGGRVGDFINGVRTANVMGQPMQFARPDRSLNRFPTAPSGGGKATDSNLSRAAMDRISPAASKAISQGRGGLY